MINNDEVICTIGPANSFWLHYLSLEKSLLEISEYIAITEDNYHCYSFKNMQLLFAVCSEVDSIFKHIQRNLYSETTMIKNPNIVNHIAMLDKFFPAVKDTLVVTKISGYVLEFQPFESLFPDYLKDIKDQKIVDKDKDKVRSWWQQYNDVKHQRLDNFDKANLQNLLESLSALHILNLIYALSIYPESIESYETALIQVNVIHQYPILQLKNSGVRSYAGGGSGFYAGNLTNRYLT